MRGVLDRRGARLGVRSELERLVNASLRVRHAIGGQRPDDLPAGGDVPVQRLAKRVRKRGERAVLAASLLELAGFDQVVDPTVVGEALELAVVDTLRDLEQLLTERKALGQVLDREQRGVPAVDRHDERLEVAE